MKKFLRVLVSVMLVLTLVACGSSSSRGKSESAASVVSFATESKNAAYEDMANSDYDYGYDEEYAPESPTSYEDNKTYNDSARKLIKTYNVNAETEAFDEFVQATEDRISALHGYIQDMDTFNGSSYNGKTGQRYCNLTVRVPAGNVDEFVNFVGNAANVTNKSLNVEDITLQYVDSESRKETYEIEQERLLALLEKCDNVEDMITIESRLSEVRYKLESQASQLRTYDNLVDYATVYLRISEVTKYTPPEPEGYWERVGRSFSEGIENVVEGFKEFFVGFVGALPGLTILAVVIVVVILVVKAIIKAGDKKRLKKQEARAEELMNQAKETARKNAENGQ
ncbi:MAG: DUF4349 domain-containing protein [Lachnospiraceae bacterium]|nr:DUF4349 domain-containing protein [Lachnospiraceae bacterium]